MKKNDSFEIVNRVSRTGLTLTVRQLALFGCIYNDGVEDSTDRYSQMLNIAKPSVTRCIDHLEELKLVERKTNPENRRKILVQKTETGKLLFEQIVH